eukprot:TRINITY_DN13004_c0_g1_i1.p1 TRINITY_DN13004_c0_g1~~TRINITY_DN13004_c0_g1_i1.p1  ORF type:complete len:209 (+),score=33.69 TRINITY_DN13004_c0_g1_i1:95-628(+)
MARKYRSRFKGPGKNYQATLANDAENRERVREHQNESDLSNLGKEPVGKDDDTQTKAAKELKDAESTHPTTRFVKNALIGLKNVVSSQTSFTATEANESGKRSAPTRNVDNNASEGTKAVQRSHSLVVLTYVNRLKRKPKYKSATPKERKMLIRTMVHLLEEEARVARDDAISKSEK